MTPLVLGEIRRVLWGSPRTFHESSYRCVRKHGRATADTGLAPLIQLLADQRIVSRSDLGHTCVLAERVSNGRDRRHPHVRQPDGRPQAVRQLSTNRDLNQ
jgi:hypothetical protein